MESSPDRRSLPGAAIGVTTLFTEQIRDYATISIANKKRYCDLHGYDLIDCPHTLDASRPPSWSKIRLIQQHLRNYQWIFWTDADSLFMNQTVRLEDFTDQRFDLIMTADPNGLNAGQFFIRNTEASLGFLATVYRQEEFIFHPWWEQAAMQHLVRTHSTCARLLVLGQRTFNSYPDSFRRGDFVIHFAGSPNKFELIRQFDALSRQAAWQRTNTPTQSTQGMRHRRVLRT